MNVESHLVPWQGTVVNNTLQSTPASKLATHSQFVLHTFTGRPPLRSKPFHSVRCSAFEQTVPLGDNQGVWKQQLIPSQSNTDAINDFGKTSAALEDAFALLKDIVEAKKGQQIDGHSVADVVRLLQDVQTLGESAFAKKQSAERTSPVAEPDLPGSPKVTVDNASNNPQSADTLRPGDKSNAIVVVAQPDKASLTGKTQQFFQNLLSTISGGGGAKSAGSFLGKAVLSVVLGGAGLFGYRALPPNNILKPPVASVVTAVPYSHFLDHVNYNVVDEIEMVGHNLLYKLKDGFTYYPGAYKPEVDLIRTAVAGIGNFLRGKHGGSPGQEVLKTTVPVGHSLPLEKLWEYGVTLAAKQPGTAPKDAATFFAALLALFVARKGGSKKPDEPQASPETSNPEPVLVNLLPPGTTPLQPAVDVPANPSPANPLPGSPPSTPNPPDLPKEPLNPSTPAVPIPETPPPPPIAPVPETPVPLLTSPVSGAPVVPSTSPVPEAPVPPSTSPVSGPPLNLLTSPVPPPPPPLPAVSPPPLSSVTLPPPSPTAPAPLNPANPDKSQLPPQRNFFPAFQWPGFPNLFKRKAPFPPSDNAQVQTRASTTADPSLPLKSDANKKTATVTTGETAGLGQEGANPTPGAGTTGVKEEPGSANDSAALPSGLTAGSGQPTTPSDANRPPTPVNVTIKNTSAARVVVYAVNSIQDDDMAGNGQPLVAWKIIDPQKTTSFVIGPQPPEIGAIQRESPTCVHRAGPFPTSHGAVWGLVQRSKLHTPVLKEATPVDFWFRFRQADAVTVVNVRPNEFYGRPYEFGYYQDSELLLLGKAAKVNDYVRFKAPVNYTAAVLTPEAMNVRAGSLLDTGQIVDHSDLAIKVREITDKHVVVTLTHDDEKGYKWV